MASDNSRDEAAPLRFSAFELNSQTGELRKHGIRIKLPDQPFQILCALVEHPGALVTRDALKQRLWPGNTAGDFEQGLNRAVSKLREALSDTAANPRFVETLPGRGYRFIGVVEDPAGAGRQPGKGNRRTMIWILAGAAVAVLVFGSARILVAPDVPPLRWRKLTTDNYLKHPPALSDGARIYFSAAFGGEQFIAQVPLSGGHPVRLPITPPGPVFTLHDVSKDGQELLLTAATAGNRLRMMPLWTLRTADGVARRLGSISATSAAYSPSDRAVVFSTATELWTASRDGSQPRRLLEAKDSVLGSVHWSLDERRIRFARSNPVSNHASPWEIDTDGRNVRRVIPMRTDISMTPSGWGPHGRVGIFAGAGTFFGISETWAPLDRGNQEVEELLRDAPEFGTSIRSRSTSLFHAMGTDRLGELQHFDVKSRAWKPLLDGISAEAAEYSPDLERVAYITYPQRMLWVRRANGTRPIQLTSPPIAAAFPRWSPDGKRIAFSAAEAADKPMRLYVVDAEGGPVRLVLPSENGSQGYPTWSPDGTKLLYGIINSSAREQVLIRVADLENGSVTRLEGSEGLFAPRWSPDGKAIAALQWTDEHHLVLFDVAKRQWQHVPGRRVDWPTWTPDSRSILCRTGNSLMNYRLETRKFEPLADLEPDEIGGFWHWIGIGPDGSPLRTRNRDSGQVYALEFEQR